MELEEKVYESMTKEELISELKSVNHILEMARSSLRNSENANEILRKSILAMIDAITDF